MGDRGFSSAAASLAEAVNASESVTIDVGQVMFGQTVTTSSDVLRQFNARGRASPRKWLILDGDSNGAGIVPYNYRRNRCRSFSPIVAEVQSPKTRSQRCCETMIFVLSSFIRLSEPISRGTVTGQRNSMTRLRVSCPTSRTSEHSSAGARRCDVRMFGCLPLDGPHREGGLLAGLRTYLPLKSHNLDATTFWSAPRISATPPSGIADSARHRRVRFVENGML